MLRWVVWAGPGGSGQPGTEDSHEFSSEKGENELWAEVEVRVVQSTRKNIVGSVTVKLATPGTDIFISFSQPKRITHLCKTAFHLGCT